jgi:hypothetical protein
MRLTIDNMQLFCGRRDLNANAAQSGNKIGPNASPTLCRFDQVRVILQG